MAIQPAIKKATLINQEGNKQVVDVGSQNATNLMGQGYALMGATPKVPSQLSSDSLTNPSPVITPVTPSFTDTNPYVAGLAPTTQGIESLVGTALAPTPQESKISPITSKITELTGQYANKPVDHQAELDKYGFQTNVNDLQKLNTQIASTKAEYDKYATGLEGKTASASSIYGRQALTQRQSAVELGGLSSMAQALQGNVQMAQSIADKTIAIKYEPLEQEIANQKYQLDQVYNQLSIDEKKKADALKITLDERQRLIDEQKTKDADINKIMTAAAQNGADSITLQKIMKSTDVNQAVINAGNYLAEAQSGKPTEIGNNLYYDPTTQSVVTGEQLMSGVVIPKTSRLAFVNNNPGNLRFAGQIGASQGEGGFARFESPEAGYEALKNQIRLDASRGLTLEKFINKYAPPSENNTGLYIQQAMSSLGVDKSTKIGDIDIESLAQFIANKESGTKISSVIPGSSNETKTIADAVISGNAKLTDIPQKDRPAVISEIQKSGKSVAEIEQKQKTAESTKGEAVSIINTLLNSKSIWTATGLSSWTTKIPGTNAYSFGRSFAQLRDLLAMGNIDKLKGAMSDKDIEFLRNSATKLALGLPKNEFISELNKLKSKLENPTSSISAGKSGTTSSGIGYTIE